MFLSKWKSGLGVRETLDPCFSVTGKIELVLPQVLELLLCVKCSKVHRLGILSGPQHRFLLWDPSICLHEILQKIVGYPKVPILSDPNEFMVVRPQEM